MLTGGNNPEVDEGDFVKVWVVPVNMELPLPSMYKVEVLVGLVLVAVVLLVVGVPIVVSPLWWLL